MANPVSRQLSELDGDSAPEPPSDLKTRLSSGFNKDPQATASKTSSSNHGVWTHSELVPASGRVARFLVSKGVKQHDTLSTFIWNSVEWAILFWAALRLGLKFVPMDPRSVERREELAYLLSTVRPHVVVVMDEEAAGSFEANGGKGGVEIVPPDSTVLALFTSGTTGKPKGCPVSLRSFVYQVDGYRRMKICQFDPSSRFLVTSPNVRPLVFLGCFAAWRSGGSMMFPNAGNAFDAESVLNAVEDFQCTNMFLVPSLVKRIVAEKGKRERKEKKKKKEEDFHAEDGGLWIVTGDDAVVDEKSDVFLVGRSKDIFETNGKVLIPGVTEGCLEKKLGLDNHVVGLPHKGSGTVPVAVVNPAGESLEGEDGRKSDVDKNEINRLIESELDQEYRLADFYRLQDVGLRDWPINSMGKIVEGEVKEEVLKMGRRTRSVRSGERKDIEDRIQDAGKR
ncbi:hypothetical protein H2203_009060 [Taxawa tesnikishii (nom. ined.)]|nr:hypothetical protein H2203_009060 [Dothideales sp. JES 119]